MNATDFIIKDDATGTPLYSVQLPDTFTARAECRILQKYSRQVLHVIGAAKDRDQYYELFFETGETYTDTPPGPGEQPAAALHSLCSASDQLDEYAWQFAGEQVPASAKYDLPQNRLRLLQSEGEKEISRNFAASQQAAAFSAVPLNVQLTGTMMDGAAGVYPLMKNGMQKTLYTAIWRIGYAVSIGMAASPFGMMGTPAVTTTATWTVPMCVNLVSDGPASDEAMNIFVGFLNTCVRTAQFDTYCDQFAENAIRQDLMTAVNSIQQNQAMISQAMAQQEAAWERTEAFGRSLSQDLDSFRAGLAANSASMDAFRSQLYSANGTDGVSVGESTDDRIQRGRHESMMGVETYIREDGTEYEHTNMDDRVFESNSDQGSHFGTQNYYDDYVPDGFHEIFRKK